MLPLILDGYTIKVKISVKPWPDVNIVMRPALPEKVYGWLGNQRALAGKQRMDSVCELLTGNLISWDVAGSEAGKTVPCSPEYWAKIPHPVLDAIVDKVTGYGVTESDEKN